MDFNFSVNRAPVHRLVIVLDGVPAVATRTYEKGSLKILWQPELCSHCENCWRGLPDVFKPDARPWVNLEGASTPDIIDQVTQCPTGALSILSR